MKYINVYAETDRMGYQGRKTGFKGGVKRKFKGEKQKKKATN